ncbi:MAG: AMP-dependent synthetase and ligase, partial [Tardiphaga sp.]|nr:AMP-dependent synthetase and ligase [Tardiphaga sp.]
PGPKLDGASVYELLSTEKVTHTAGVPTVWLMLLQHMAKEKLTLPHLKMVICGGSAMPRAMIKQFRDMGAQARHAWGMTEMSPLGTLAALKPPYVDIDEEATLDVLATQGYPAFGVQMKITDDAGKRMPWDGKTFGRLKVRGPAIAKAYFRVDRDILDDEGYFDTGDVATVDANAYMRITDRSKDVIKSGGEWISSNELENLAVGQPKLAEAAVIGVYHPKWDERPLLIVQMKPEQTVTKDELLRYMDGKIAKWWMPDDVAFVDAIPHTATGKILKTALRDQFKDYRFPNAAA